MAATIQPRPRLDLGGVGGVMNGGGGGIGGGAGGGTNSGGLGVVSMTRPHYRKVGRAARRFEQ